MNIAHLTWLLSVAGGGIPPVVLALAREQRTLGMKVRVLGVMDPASGNPEAAELHRAVGPLALGFAPGLGKALKDSQPDLVHLHGLFTWTSRIASRWGRRSGCPVMVTPHGMLEPWALANSAWKKRLFRALVEDRNLARARCLHALSAAEAANLRRLGLSNPVVIIPNGVDLKHVPDTADRGALVRTFPQLAGRRVLLFLGRLHPKKGLLHLVKAWRALRDDGAAREWALLIAGPDQVGHGAQVAGLLHALGLERDALMVGPLFGEAKSAALAGAHAFVLPSFSEGFPMAVLEAMAWRLPVVISRPCNLDVSTPGAGLLCDPDAESVALSLRDLFALTDAQRQAMGERGRAEIEHRYTWPLVAAQLTEVYRWLLGDGDLPRMVEAFP